MQIPERDANGFPIYRDFDDLPDGMSEKELYELAFRLIAEHGEHLGDYLVAATDHALKGGSVIETVGPFLRWVLMSERIEKIIGKPVTLTYRHCDEAVIERAG